MLTRGLIGLALFVGCSAAAAEPALESDVDLITVEKSAHTLSVSRDGRVLKIYAVALGHGGPGPKREQGDGKVPEGEYRITGRNPASAYHLSLRIGYPTAAQRADAQAQEIDPGGDIMIHGLPNGQGALGAAHLASDWTDGCIAVTDDEIEELWDHVPDGTPIVIRP